MNDTSHEHCACQHSGIPRPLPIGSIQPSRIEYLDKQSDDLNRCSFFLIRIREYHPGHPDGEYRRGWHAQIYKTNPRTKGYPMPEELDGMSDAWKKANLWNKSLATLFDHLKESKR